MADSPLQNAIINTIRSAEEQMREDFEQQMKRQESIFKFELERLYNLPFDVDELVGPDDEDIEEGKSVDGEA